LHKDGGDTLLQVIQKTDWDKKHDAAWVYSGICMHLYGMVDLSGHNGLGRYKVESQKDRFILNVIRQTMISRTYGGVPTGTDTYTGVHLDWKLLEGSIAVKEDGLEAVMAVEGTIGLVTLIKKGKDLFKKIPKLGKEVEKQLDRLIAFFERSGMPKVEFTGNEYIHLGLSSKGIPFYRVGLEGKATVKIQQKGPAEIIKKLGIPTSATTGGRSWQIDLRRVDAHFPRHIW
jgi:hypothetical protein